jgi:superfamily I DNA and/or RNA helicase
MLSFKIDVNVDLYSEIRQTISKFKKNENRTFVKKAFVVGRYIKRNNSLLLLFIIDVVLGVTCMAASFEVLDGTQFQLIILDECSQLTEPTALLSIAKFKSKRLVISTSEVTISHKISYDS